MFAATLSRIVVAKSAISSVAGNLRLALVASNASQLPVQIDSCGGDDLIALTVQMYRKERYKKDAPYTTAHMTECSRAQS